MIPHTLLVNQLKLVTRNQIDATMLRNFAVDTLRIDYNNVEVESGNIILATNPKNKTSYEVVAVRCLSTIRFDNIGEFKRKTDMLIDKSKINWATIMIGNEFEGHCKKYGDLLRIDSVYYNYQKKQYWYDWKNMRQSK